MTAATVAPVSGTPRNFGFVLASALFADVSTLPRAPSDSNFANWIIVRAFYYLNAGMWADWANMDTTALRECADNIAACRYLSAAVRQHVSKALHGMADGTTPPPLALELVHAAADRHAHQMVMDAIHAIGSDGLGEIAGAIELLAPINEGED